MMIGPLAFGPLLLLVHLTMYQTDCMQATWKWLSDVKHGIPKEHRQQLMAQYSTLMRAETEADAEEYMAMLRETTTFPKYRVRRSKETCIQYYIQSLQPE